MSARGGSANGDGASAAAGGSVTTVATGTAATTTSRQQDERGPGEWCGCTAPLRHPERSGRQRDVGHLPVEIPEFEDHDKIGLVGNGVVRGAAANRERPRQRALP